MIALQKYSMSFADVLMKDMRDYFKSVDSNCNFFQKYTPKSKDALSSKHSLVIDVLSVINQIDAKIVFVKTIITDVIAHGANSSQQDIFDKFVAETDESLQHLNTLSSSLKEYDSILSEKIKLFEPKDVDFIAETEESIEETTSDIIGNLAVLSKDIEALSSLVKTITESYQ